MTHVSIYNNFSHSFPELGSSQGALQQVNGHIQTTEMDYEKSELPSQEKTQRKCVCILLSVRGPSGKGAYRMVTTLWKSGKSRPVETEEISAC